MPVAAVQYIGFTGALAPYLAGFGLFFSRLEKQANAIKDNGIVG